MSKEIKMPQLSDTMDKGKILTWHKKEGDSIIRGDVLAEVETDKANLEIESFDEGTLLKIVIPADESALVGEIIAVIGEAGEEVNISAETKSSNANSEEVKELVETKIESVPVETSSPVLNVASPVSTPNGRVKASPIAKKLAKDLNVDLSLIQGSGPAGRIIKKDIETFSDASSGQAVINQSPAPVASIVASATPLATSKLVPQMPKPMPVAIEIPIGLSTLSKMRETIANRMEIATDTPHFFTTVSIDMTEAIKLRASFKVNPNYSSISINHMIIKAAGYALTQAPMVNCAYKEGQLFNPGSFNVGVITSVSDGLLIPVVKEVDTKHILDIAQEARGLIDRAREKKPRPDDLTGGTFSISNMGMFDVESFTAIVNPGQGAVLAISSTTEQAVVEQGNIVVRPKMKVTLSVDHRIIDGLVAGTFLSAFKSAMESPALMML